MAASVLPPISILPQTLKREQDTSVIEPANASYVESNKPFSLNGHLSPVNYLFRNLSSTKL